MDTRNLKQRLSDPDWVKDWFDQAGSEALKRIEELEALAADIAEHLGKVHNEMRPGPDGEGADIIDMIEACAADLRAAAQSEAD